MGPPSTGSSFLSEDFPGTVIAGLLVGLIATVISGVIPARRATQVEPVAAMREADVPGSGRVGVVRIVAAAIRQVCNA